MITGTETGTTMTAATNGIDPAGSDNHWWILPKKPPVVCVIIPSQRQ